MINLEKLDAALTWIEENPERHDQSVWYAESENYTCGTAMCLAGALVHLEGFEFVIITGDYGRGAAHCRKEPTGGAILIDHAAKGILGAVTEDEIEAIDHLFAGVNSLDTLKQMRDAIAAGEIDRVAYL